MVSATPKANSAEPKSVIARANLKLWQCIRNAARGVECEFHKGTLTLKGRLATALQRERAVAAVKEIRNVTNVKTAIEVG